jgi:hypothetical protein
MQFGRSRAVQVSSGRWQTTSTLLPSGSRTNAEIARVVDRPLSRLVQDLGAGRDRGLMTEVLVPVEPSSKDLTGSA